MICVFPDPHPDELLYSVCARYNDLMQYPNSTTATRNFFGVGSISAVVDLPNKIDYLISELPPGHLYTADHLIDNHTLFPLYASFLQRERARVVRDGMRRVGENQIYEQIGLTASSVPQPQWLRFCPKCVEADRGSFGETYWHRIHQISGVEVCPHHAVFLELSDAPFRNLRNPGEATSAESALHNAPIRPLSSSDKLHNILLDIARNAVWLLKWKEGKHGNDHLRERYYNHLLRLGLAYYNGNVRASELADEFCKHYPAELLESLTCQINDYHRNWLLRLLHSGSTAVSQHPIRHLLLILFLGITTEEFFTSSEPYKPFGDSPWPCLNHAAEHFRQPVITECRITDNLVKKKTGRPLGTFNCECGFVYNRVGPDTSDEDRYRNDSVESYGPVWEQVLREAWSDTSLSVGSAARRLGVSDLTAVRYAIRLDLPMNAPGFRQVSPKTIERHKNFRRSRQEALEHYRKEWLSVLGANPDASRRQLMTLKSFLYLWLRKNDSEWLEVHLPPVIKGERKSELKDWENIDVELAAAVQATAKRIRGTPGRPIRISLAAIAKEVGHKAWLEHRLHKLPLTSKALDDCLESVEEFLIRRVRWAEEYYFQKGVVPMRSYFEANAGTRHKSGKRPAVQNEIDAALERLNTRLSSTLARL
jgi:hypothetical protein